MKLYDLIKNGKHNIYMDTKDDAVLEQLEVRMIDAATGVDLGNIAEYVEKAQKEGKKITFLDDGKGGIQMVEDNKPMNISVAYVDEEGKLETVIPSATTPTVSPDCVCLIGDVEYKSLGEAVNASKNGDILRLIKDTAEDITIAKAKDIVIDVQRNVTLKNVKGHTITNNGKLVLRGFGTIDNITHRKADILNNVGANVKVEGNLTFIRSAEAGLTETSDGGNS